MKSVFLAWQAPADRSWRPIGRLNFDGTTYQFLYVMGAREAAQSRGFRPLESFPHLSEVYESDELFPLFANRLPSRQRPEYPDYIEWLNVPGDKDDPIALLARSGGRRATDSFEVFPCPEPDDEGRYHVHFFAHGLRHLPDSSIERIGRLRSGERLRLMHDLQNEKDAFALVLRTSETTERDLHIVGYCPRYLLSDACELLESPHEALVTVERVNLPPAPLQLRLLCNLTAAWPADFRPCDTPAFQPITTPEPTCTAD